MHSKKELLKRIEYAKRMGDEEKVKKYTTWLLQRENLPPIQNDSFDNAIKNDDITLLFKRGESKIHLFSKNTHKSFSLKCNGKVPPNLMSTDELRKTLQYKRLSSLGFKTFNGRTYTYSNNNHLVWLSLSRSRINKIKINDLLVDSIMLRWCFRTVKLIRVSELSQMEIGEGKRRYDDRTEQERIEGEKNVWKKL